MLSQLISAGILSGVALGPVPAEEASIRTSDDRPNIVFIFTDDHAAHAISSYGSVINETPHIDRLADEGMRFANCFCGNSICAPSRATVLTGTHSHINGVRDNGGVFDGAQITFPKLMHEAGYTTALFGKWHLKSDPTGFDAWQVYPGQGSYYNPDYITPEGRHRVEGYSVELTTDLALDWLTERDGDEPFLLMLQYKAPHREWAPGPKYLNKYADEDLPEPATLFDDYEGRNSGAKTQEMEIDRHMRMDADLKNPSENPDEWTNGWKWLSKRMTPEQKAQWDAAYGPRNRAMREANLEGRDLVRWKYQRYVKDYLRCIAAVDDNIGRVLDYLDESGLAKDTIVIYSSDQGFYLGDHGWYDKRWIYEESLRMPLLVRWPGVVRPGSVNEDLVQNIDFAPTLLDAVGLDAPDRMQGTSALPLLKGSEVPWRDAIYYHYYESQGPHRVPKHYGVRTDRYKLAYYYELDEWELFDLETDPDELTSIFDEPSMRPIVESLFTRMQELQEQYGDPDVEPVELP